MGPLGVKGAAAGAGVSTSDAQYMQQQSQIFVFTTHLANKAAEAVMQGSFNTIIAFHCAQPGTKKLLEVSLGFLLPRFSLHSRVNSSPISVSNA